jgi:hypothetical protein
LIGRVRLVEFTRPALGRPNAIKSASRSAIVAPIPRADSVTTATFPYKLFHGADTPWLLDDCVSQGPDPVLKPLCLHHHHLAVVGAERNSRHALKGGEQMDREFS